MNNESEDKREMSEIYDCIVIGSGISGISFAHNLAKKDKRTLLLESEDVIGGQIATHVSRQFSDFWSELGAHTCYNSYTHLLSLVDDVNAHKDLLALDKRKYMIYDGSKIKSPLSEISFLPFMFNGLRIFSRSKEGRTVREYFRPIVGGKNYDKLFTKMFRAVISQEPDDYPAEVFLKKRNERRRDVIRKYSFTRGLSSFLNTIIEHDKFALRLNTKVENIEQRNDIFEVKAQNGRIYKAHNIAVATDPQVAARLIVSMEPDVAELLSSIELFKSSTLNVIVRKGDISIPLLAGIIPTSDLFLSVVSRDVSSHPSLRSFSFHFKEDKSEVEKIEIVCDVLGIAKDSIVETSSVNHILPTLRKQHINIAEDVQAKQINPNIYILGNYFYGLSLEDCVHRSSDEAQRFMQDDK